MFYASHATLHTQHNLRFGMFNVFMHPSYAGRRVNYSRMVFIALNFLMYSIALADVILQAAGWNKGIIKDGFFIFFGSAAMVMVGISAALYVSFLRWSHHQLLIFSTCYTLSISIMKTIYFLLFLGYLLQPIYSCARIPLGIFACTRINLYPGDVLVATVASLHRQKICPFYGSARDFTIQACCGKRRVYDTASPDFFKSI